MKVYSLSGLKFWDTFSFRILKEPLLRTSQDSGSMEACQHLPECLLGKAAAKEEWDCSFVGDSFYYFF